MWWEVLIPLLRIAGLLVASKAALCVLRRLLITAVLRISLGRCAVLGGRCAVLRLALGLILVLLRISEIDIVRHDLCAPALVAFLIRPATDLKSAGHYDHAALFEILLHELCGTSPGYAVQKIGFLLLPFRCPVPVAGNGETGYGNSAAGAA